MARGKNIQDFKELKKLLGSLPDSGEKNAAAPKRNSAGPVVSQGIVPEPEFRPGRQVVLMTSSLRGKIVSAGKRLKVEIEDGLVIEVDYCEVALSDPAEERLMTMAVPKAGKREALAAKSVPARKKYSDNISVDLHIEALPGGRSVPAGSRLEFQLQCFRRVMRENLRHPGMRIRFIHGVGDGILRSALRKELDEMFAMRCTWLPGEAGVTVVTIK